MNNILNLIKLQFSNIFSVKKSLLISILIGIFIGVTNKNMLSYIGGLYIMITCYSTTAYEEKNKLDYLIKSLPVSSKDFILSKYIYIFINTIIAIIFTYVISIFTMSNSDSLKIALITVFSMGVIAMAVVIPMALIFGFQKGKIFMIIMLIIPLSVSMELMNLKSFNLINNLNLNFILIGLSIIITVVSYFITSNAYRRKEL